MPQPVQNSFQRSEVTPVVKPVSKKHTLPKGLDELLATPAPRPELVSFPIPEGRGVRRLPYRPPIKLTIRGRKKKIPKGVKLVTSNY